MRDESGCRTIGCSLNQQQKDQAAGNEAIIEKQSHERKCAAGNKNYCSGNPVEIATFVGISLIGGATLEAFILGGGVAAMVEALPSLAENSFRQVAIMCLKNPLCARAIGAGQGVTVLGKIIEGEEPPGYVKIGQQINGRYLYVKEGFTPEMQDQFWNETKALGKPVLLANDYTQFAGSTFSREVNDLITSGWNIIFNILAYPPKQ
jgi:hypothetical protein